MRTMAIALACLFLTGVPARSADKEDLFTSRVLPLLQAKCLPCHGNDARKLQLSVDGLYTSIVASGVPLLSTPPMA